VEESFHDATYTSRVDWLIFGGVVVVLIALGVLAQRMGWIDLSTKNRAGGGRAAGGAGMMAVDEVFHPAAYEAHLEQDRETSLPAPAPIAGDGDRDVYKGSVRIRL
jgi:hypothetical protein